jgi:hypothetical protein
LAAGSKINDTDVRSGAVGVEYATSAVNTVGAEYRYTNTDFTNVGVSSPDYNEERARVFVKYLFSEKTEIDANVGYLRRDYTDHEAADFSGDVWHISAKWQATDKVQVIGLAWRELQAYFTAESNYYVSNGVSVAPVWVTSEKITISALVSTERQEYTGAAQVDIAGPAARHDRLTAEQASVTYIPLRSLALNLAIRREQRESNYYQFTYGDTIASAGFTYKFQP